MMPMKNGPAASDEHELHDSAPVGSDPVVELYKKDVDRTLLVENLRLTSEQRSQKFLRNMKMAYELLGVSKRKG